MAAPQLPIVSQSLNTPVSNGNGTTIQSRHLSGSGLHIDVISERIEPANTIRELAQLLNELQKRLGFSIPEDPIA